MTYLPETYYFYKKDFSLEKAVIATAQKLSEWSTHYKAELISPMKGVKETKRQGELPTSVTDKHRLIDDLVKWIFSSSETQELFTLFLDDSDVTEHREGPGIFDHWDDTCCWSLNLTQEQFEELKSAWKNNGLPEDLFYPEDKAVKIVKPLGIVGKFFTALGFTWENSACYSPKEWEEKNKN
jgi:hypothetical protein